MEKIMTFIVATNVVASRPPKRRQTGMPHALANFDPRKIDMFCEFLRALISLCTSVII